MFQRHPSENRPEIDENLKNRKSLWSYTCSGFSCLLLKIDPDRDGKKRSGATPVVVSAIYKARRDPDPARLEIYRYRF